MDFRWIPNMEGLSKVAGAKEPGKERRLCWLLFIFHFHFDFPGIWETAVLPCTRGCSGLVVLGSTSEIKHTYLE